MYVLCFFFIGGGSDPDSLDIELAPTCDLRGSELAIKGVELAPPRQFVSVCAAHCPHTHNQHHTKSTFQPGKTSILSEYLRGLDKDADKLLCVSGVSFLICA